MNKIELNEDTQAVIEQALNWLTLMASIQLDDEAAQEITDTVTVLAHTFDIPVTHIMVSTDDEGTVSVEVIDSEDPDGTVH